MKYLFPRVIVAGLRGGSGKTTLSLGLIAAWRKRGRSLIPYKKGPDYIDAGWLSAAAGRLCYNLDPFLIGQKRILSSFKEHFLDADCAVIEGNRGLYDGMDSRGTYSTAELAKILKAPVVLIMDCSKVTRTAGAMVLGMQKFDKRVRIEGVVLNRIAGARHEKIIREVIERYCEVRVVGAIPKLDEVVSERHMGLTSFQEHPDVERAISTAGDIAEKYIDLDAIWDIANGADSLAVVRDTDDCVGREMARDRPVIGVIRDSAFQFYYPENIEELINKGAIIREVSALTEKKLPDDLDALYIGGGFPETNAIALAKNVSFRKSVLSAVENGLPVYAECGGLMYLGEALLLGGRNYPMTGVFPVTFCLEKKPQAHGYTVVEVSKKNPFYPRGTVLKGHEFHYSRVVDLGKKDGVTFSFMMKRGQGIRKKSDGVCYRNVLATYTHLHAYGSPEWAEGLLRKATAHKKERGLGVTKRKDNKADRRG